MLISRISFLSPISVSDSHRLDVTLFKQNMTVPTPSRWSVFFRPVQGVAIPLYDYDPPVDADAIQLVVAGTGAAGALIILEGPDGKQEIPYIETGVPGQWTRYPLIRLARNIIPLLALGIGALVVGFLTIRTLARRTR